MTDYDNDMSTPLTKEEQAFISRKAHELAYLFDGPDKPLRAWEWHDAVGEGFSALIHSFDTSKMENDRLDSLVGLSDEQYADAIHSGRVMNEERLLGMLPREERDKYIQDKISRRKTYQDKINDAAKPFEPAPHSLPGEGDMLGKIGYYGLQSIPSLLAGFGEFAALGPTGMLMANTYSGNQASREQVYENLLKSGKSIDEAREGANNFWGNFADTSLRGVTNLAVMNALSNTITPQWTPGSISPIAQTAGNILTAGAVAGAGAEATKALTNYRSGIENDIKDLAATGLISGAQTAAIGTLSALARAKKIWELQKQYNANTPIEVEARDVTQNNNNMPALPQGGEPTDTTPQDNVPPTPDTPNAPSGISQPPAAWENVMSKYGFPTNSTYSDVMSYIQHLRISPKDAATMLSELGMPPEAVQDAMNSARQARLADTRQMWDVQVHRMEQSKPTIHGYGTTPVKETWQDPLSLRTDTTPHLLPQSERSQVNVQQMPITRPDINVRQGLTTTPQVIPLMLPEVKTNRLDTNNSILQAPDYKKTPEQDYADWEDEIKTTLQVDHLGEKHNINILTGNDYAKPEQSRAFGPYLEFVDDDGQTVAKYMPYTDKFYINPSFEKVGWVRQTEDILRKNMPEILKDAGMLDGNGQLKPDGNEDYRSTIYGNNPAWSPTKATPINEPDEDEDDSDIDEYSGTIPRLLPSPPDEKTTQQQPAAPVTPVGEPEKKLADQFRSSVNPNAIDTLIDRAKKGELPDRLADFLGVKPESKNTQQLTPAPVQDKKNATTDNKHLGQLNFSHSGIHYNLDVSPNESGTFDPAVEIYHGRIFKITDDKGNIVARYSPYTDTFTLASNHPFSEINGFRKIIETQLRKKLPEILKSAGLLDTNGNLIPDGKEQSRANIAKKYGLPDIKTWTPKRTQLKNGILDISGTQTDGYSPGRWESQWKAIVNNNTGTIHFYNAYNKGGKTFASYDVNSDTFSLLDDTASWDKYLVKLIEQEFRKNIDKFVIGQIPGRAYEQKTLQPSTQQSQLQGESTSTNQAKNTPQVTPAPLEAATPQKTAETAKNAPDTGKKNEQYRPSGHKLVGHINVMEAGKDITFDVYRYDYGDGKYKLRTTAHGQDPNGHIPSMYDFRYDPEKGIITSGNPGSTSWNNKFEQALRGKLPELLKAAGLNAQDKETEQENTPTKNNWEFSINDKTFKVILDPSQPNRGKFFQVLDGDNRLAEYSPYVDTYFDELSKTGYAPDIKLAVYTHLPQWLKDAGLLDNNGNLIPDGRENERHRRGYHDTWTSKKNAARLRTAQRDLEQREAEIQQRRQEKEAADKEQKTQQQTQQPQKTDTTTDGFNLTPYQQIAQKVKELVIAGQNISNKQLFDIAASAFGGTLGEGKFTEKDAYDAMEMGVNLAIQDMKYSPNQPHNSNIAGSFTADINDLQDSILSKLPTQSNRTDEQNEFQQFSTPPHLAYLVNWLANIHEDDIVLEPSAGLGGIAVFAKNAGATLILNELSDRRFYLLKSMNLGTVFHENAEHIADILYGRGYNTAAKRPNKVIMNPPFSSTAGRIHGQRDAKNGMRHVEEAMKFLVNGGRLVVILGKNMNDNNPYWTSFKEKYNVRANVTIDGGHFYKFGTTFGNAIVVIDKTGPTPKNSTVTGNFESIIDIHDALKDIRENIPAITREAEQAKAPEPKTNQGANSQPAQSQETPKTERTPTQTKPESTPKTEKTKRKEGTATAKPEQDNLSKRSIDKIKAESSPVKISKRTDAERAKKQSEARKYYEDLFGKQDDEALFEPYVPSKLKIEHAKPHPADLVESAAMSAIKMPDITYSPVLPHEVVEKGLVSEEQLEAVTYAGQAHQKFLPSGERQGFLIGDGTGVGKGTEILSIIMDNFAQGHGNGKAVWLSVNTSLSDAAKGDWKRLGNNPDNIFTHSSKTENIPQDRKGILFMGYQTLITKRDPKGGDNTLVHLEQIKNWLGEDFDGVIVLDECHKVRNSVVTKGGRGKIEPAQSATAAQDLLRAFPNARVVYASATNATDATHFCMFGRLGLWGTGTAFSSDSDFVLEMNDSGVSALEIVARTLKARGLFISRSISFRAGPNGNNENVNFSVLEHKLTPIQKKIYDTVAKALRITEKNIEAAVKVCGGGVDKSTKDSRKRGAAASQYWSLHQRICLQLITAFKTDTIIKDIQDTLDRGESALVNLSTTGDANFERAYNKMKTNPNMTLDDLDISLIDPLISMVEESFPIYSVESYQEEGSDTIKYRNVKDSDGNPVINQHALALLEETVSQLNMVRGEIPTGLIDAITLHFGTDLVAECTTRSHRLVKGKDGKRAIIGPPDKLREADSFNNGKKRILIFSEAGATGVSYHASKAFKNQQKRRLLVAEPGWSSFTFVQALGRVHRSNQVHKPDIVLVSTDLPGELRIRSTVTRRMLQLGASSTGERKANSQGLLTDRDNLESEEANTAIRRLFNGIFKQQYPDMPTREVLEQMGYKPENFEKQFPQMTQILNRLMAMDVDYQFRFFKHFDVLRDEAIDEAIKKGSYDIGLSTVKAQSITVINEEIIKTDKETGIDTKYVQLELQKKRRRRSFESLEDGQYDSFFMTSEGQIVAARKLGERDSNGNLIRPRTEFVVSEGETYQIYSIVSPDFTYKREISQRLLDNKSDKQQITFTPVAKKEAKNIWNEQLEQLTGSKTENMHLITGDLLSLWHTLTGYTGHIERVVSSDGREFLGISIQNEDIANVLIRFNLHYHGIGKDFNSLMLELNKQGNSLVLNNGLTVKYSRVNGEKIIEIVPKQYFRFSDMDYFRNKGFIIRIINHQDRVFVPIGQNNLLEDYINEHPVTEIQKTDLLAEATQEINANIPDESLDNMHIIHPFFKVDPNENPYIQSSKYAASDPETERRYQRSKTPDKPTLWHEISHSVLRLWKGFSDFPELEGYDSLIKAHEWLRQLNRARKADVQEVFKRIRAALYDLDTPDDFDLFSRAMQLADLKETLELNSNAQLPWGYNPNSLHVDYNNIMKEVEKNPRVKKAIDKAEKLGAEIVKQLAKAADMLQMFDIRDKLKRQHYFRHVVLEYYHQAGGSQPRPTMKNPERRGYLKHREGSEKDISSDWIMAMGEAWVRMTDDIKILSTLAKLRNEYDIIEDLKQKAFTQNYQKALHKIIADLSDSDLEDIEFTDAGVYNRAREKLDKTLTHRQAQSVDRLFKLAKNGDLPAGDNNEWLEFLAKFSDAGQLEKLDSDTLKQFTKYIGWLASLEPQKREPKSRIRARSSAQRFIRGDISKQSGLKKILGEDYIKWQDLIPKDYDLWSPSDSRLVFSANSVAENALMMAQENLDELLGVPISDLGKALSSGGNKQLWCIPEKLAVTLNTMGQKQPQGMLARAMRKGMIGFQQYVLMTPASGRGFKYNWRNFFGDLEAVLQGNPAALLYLKRACKELSTYMLKGGEPEGMLAEFVKRGGGLTTEFATELEQWQDKEEFARLAKHERTLNPFKLIYRSFKWYIRTASLFTNFREAILRYASFLAYYDQIKENQGNAPFYGMSKPKEVQAVNDDIYEMAMKLSNENLGAYDQVSQNTQWLRDNSVMTFISWREVNFKRTVQMMKNIWTGNSYLEYYIKKHGQKLIDAFTGGNGGGKEPPKPPKNNGSGWVDDNAHHNWKRIKSILGKSPNFILRFLITTALFSPLAMILGLINSLNGENEKNLSPNDRNIPHLTFNTNPVTGEVLYMSRLGSAFDFSKFLGVDDLIFGNDLRDLLDGRKSLLEIAGNIASGPINELLSNVNPFAKAAAELLLGRRLYPDFRKPSTIRDGWRYVAQSLALDWYYDALTGKPHKPASHFASSFFDTQKPDEAAYWYILSKKNEFEEKKLGRHYDGFAQTERSETLRQAKRAAAFGDRTTMRKYIKEYRKAGGEWEGLEQSARTMDPLFGLNEREQRQFRKWLAPEDNEALTKAYHFYRNTSRTLTRR